MLKKLRNYIERKGIAYDIFLSHILVLVIPILLNVVIECVIINSVKTETANNGFLVVENARNNMDNLIGNIQKTVNQINSNENMLPIYQYSKQKDDFGLKKSVDMLKYTCRNTDDIEDIFVYNEDSDIIITTSGRGFSDTFFDAYYAGTNIDYKQWKEDVTQLKDGMFRVVYSSDLSVVEHLEYVCPLTGNQIESYTRADSNFPAVLTVRMNKDKFNVSSAIEANFQGMLLYAVTLDGKVICKGDTSKYNVQPILSDYDGEKSWRFEKDGMMYICRASQINDWIYVSASPIWKYNKTSIISIIVIFIGSIIIFVLGLRIILRFIRVNYDGIINFSDRMKREFNMQKNIKINDIDNCFEIIFNERNKLKKEITDTVEIQYSASVLKMLGGVSEERKAPEFKKIQEYMHSDAFCVICCQIEDSSGLYADSVYEQMSDEEKDEDAYFIVRNVLTELFEVKYSVISLPIGGRNVFLVGNKKEDFSVFENELFDMAVDFAESLLKQFGISCIVSIGNIAYSYDDVSKSYYDATDVFKYSILLGDGRVLSVKDFSGRNDRYKITQYHKEALSANILSGNTDGAMAVLNELYDININKYKLNAEMIKCFLMDLSDEFEEICRNRKINIKEDIAITVFGFNRIDDTKKFFEKLIVEICDEINEDKHTNQEELVEKIKLYIDIYYSDYTINVDSISNLFGLTRAYVSKIFKKYTGDSILDTIHKRRIEQAEILLSEGKRVNEVAELVGYVNSDVFTRTFKKYKGITPSQFNKI